MITLIESEWSSDDSISLRNFLASSTGKRLLIQLSAQCPSPCADDENPNTSFARSRSIAGYEKCMTELVALSRPEEKPIEQPENASEYKDLDDDSQWPEAL